MVLVMDKFILEILIPVSELSLYLMIILPLILTPAILEHMLSNILVPTPIQRLNLKPNLHLHPENNSIYINLLLQDCGMLQVLLQLGRLMRRIVIGQTINLKPKSLKLDLPVETLNIFTELLEIYT